MKSWQLLEVKPRKPRAASALPLSHNSQTTTNSHNLLYILPAQCLRDITTCLSTWGVIFVLEDFFKFLPCHIKVPPGDSKAEGTQVHLGMTTFLKTVRQCKSYWIHTINLILGESLLTIKLYLIMTSFLTKLTSFF